MPRKIYKQIEKLWNDTFTHVQLEVPLREEYKNLADEFSAENRKTSYKKLQPWLGIFEFGLSLLADIHFALEDKNYSFPKWKKLIVPFLLTGSAHSFGVSLRSLCLDGFDAAAKVLLRSYSDTLFTCLALLDDEDLGKEFSKISTNEEKKNFYQKKLSPGKLNARLQDIEKRLNFPECLIDVLSAWRKEEYEVLAETSHISYVAAIATVYPRDLKDDSYRHGIFGIATSNSTRTLTYAAALTFYFSIVSNFLIFSINTKNRKLILLDKKNNLHQQILVAQHVLEELFLLYWKDEYHAI